MFVRKFSLDNFKNQDTQYGCHLSYNEYIIIRNNKFIPIVRGGKLRVFNSKTLKIENFIQQTDTKGNVLYVHEDDLEHWWREQSFLEDFQKNRDEDLAVTDFEFAYGGWDSK